MITYSWREVLKNNSDLYWAFLGVLAFPYGWECSLGLVNATYRWPKSMNSVIYKVRWGFSVLGMNKATGRSFRRVNHKQNHKPQRGFDIQSKDLVLLAFCVNSKYIGLHGV